jgi:hypothetical protein
MEEVLAVDKGDGSLDGGLGGHGQKITPSGPYGKSNGEEVMPLSIL